MLAQQLDGEQQQVVEIDGIELFQLHLIPGEHRADKRLFVLRRIPAVVLGFADERFGDVGLQLLADGRGFGDDLLDEAVLVALVVDGEILFVAEPLDVGAQDANAQGVEGGHRHLGSHLLVYHPSQALAHFFGGLIGERDGEDRVRVDLLRQHVGDAHRDDARLARARPGKNQQRPLDGGRGVALGVVEIEKAEGHGCGNGGFFKSAKL